MSSLFQRRHRKRAPAPRAPAQRPALSRPWLAGRRMLNKRGLAMLEIPCELRLANRREAGFGYCERKRKVPAQSCADLTYIVHVKGRDAAGVSRAKLSQ